MDEVYNELDVRDANAKLAAIQAEMEKKLEKEKRLQDVRDANAKLAAIQAAQEEERLKKIRAEAEARGEVKRRNAASSVITKNLRANMEKRIEEKEREKRNRKATKLQAAWRIWRRGSR